MAHLSVLQIYEVARQAGFSHDQAVTWTAIAMAESRGNTLAHATHGEDSRGLWQVNVNPSVRQNTYGDLFDPLTNAKAAYQISGHGTNLQPWSTTHASNAGTPQDYRTYLGEAQAAAGQAGDAQGHFQTGQFGTAAEAHVTSTALNLDDPNLHVQPVTGGKLVDTFGAPRPGGRKHEGIDILGHEGTPIHAVASGEIVKGFDNPLGGTVVRIQGDDGRYYYYAHLAPDSVKNLHVGQHVHAGDVIGGMSNTGDAEGGVIHLHFQVAEGGKDLDPFTFLQGLPTIEDVSSGAHPLSAVPAVDPFAIDAGAAADAPDTDHDGLTDDFEKMFGTNPNQVDSDHDGLSDAYETGTSHTDPLLADTDHDKLSDLEEVVHGTDAGHVPLPAAARAAGFGGLATMDSDHDGLSDKYELKIGTDPLKADTDGDHLTDSFERVHGFNPLQIDSDHDGLTDDFAVAGGQTTGPITATTPLGTGGVGTDGGLGTGGLGTGGALGTGGLGGQQPEVPNGTDPVQDDHHALDASYDTH